MVPIANESAPRVYRSDLRQQQAAETRDRILDATVRLMAEGIGSVSIPAVARQAGVSVPTIYRHFGTKRDLLAALYPHVVHRAGLDDLVLPRSLDELPDGVRAIFSRLDSLDDVARAALASPAAEEARRVTMPDRINAVGRFTESVAPGLPKIDRDRITRLLVILTMSSALRAWRDQFGSAVEEVADDIDWVIRAAIAAATSSQGR